jgi:ATP-dependent Clp protease, protease subunit
LFRTCQFLVNREHYSGQVSNAAADRVASHPTESRHSNYTFTRTRMNYRTDPLNNFSREMGGASTDLSAASSYQSYQRQRQLTLGDLLLENRIVFLQGEIHTGNANELVMKLLYLQSENRRKDIHFYINSPGGSVTATLAIYDTMRMLTCSVATYCVGEACSGGAVLLVGGTEGKRYCLPNSRVMIHQPLGGVGGQVSDIEIQAAEMFRYRDKLNEILSKHTKKPVDQIAKDTERDFFLSAEQAVAYGLVDSILTRPPSEEIDD